MAVPTWVPLLFVIAYASEVGHMLLHVAQLFQYEIYHIYPRKGLLGPALVNNEWLHFSEVLGFFIAITLVWFGYGAARRASWRRGAAAGYWAYCVLLVVSFYHLIEHSVKIDQYLTTGKVPAPGILGYWVNVVWLHAIINSVEVLLASLVLASVRPDREILFLERQRQLMSRSRARVSSVTRAGWTWRGFAICTGPLLILFSDAVGPLTSNSAALTVHRIAAAHGAFDLSAFTGLVGAALLIPAASGLLQLGGEDSWALRVGALLTSVGAIGLVAFMGLFLLAGNAGVLASHGASGPYVRLAATVLHPHGYLLLLWVMTAMLLPGFVILAAGLYARKAVPLWAAVCIGVGIIGQMWGHLEVNLVGLWAAGNVLWTIGLFPVGLGLIRDARRSQEAEPLVSTPQQSAVSVA